MNSTRERNENITLNVLLLLDVANTVKTGLVVGEAWIAEDEYMNPCVRYVINDGQHALHASASPAPLASGEEPVLQHAPGRGTIRHDRQDVGLNREGYL